MDYEWIKTEIPLAAGLDTKGDIRSGKPPKLDIARDVAFGEPGGVQSRFPFLAFSNAIFGGGTLSNCRRLGVVNDELVVFTDTGLYSWNAQLQKWVLRGTHLAVNVDEQPRFVTSGDQVQGDRAELNGTVVYTWADAGGSYLAAIDKTTGSVLMPATLLGAGIVRPRLVAASTKILGFCLSGTTLLFAIIDPANPAAAVFNTLFTGVNGPYDVSRVEAQDAVVGAHQRTVTTSYTVWTVTAAGVTASSTKARTCDGPIAVATIPGGTQTQVIRGNGTNVQGDLLTTSTFADVFTGQAIGTASVSLHQIAVAFSTVQVGGFYVAHAFWSRAESATGVDGSVVHNTVNTNNAVGTAASFVLRLGVVSRAFAAQGRVFLWLGFARENEVTGLSGAVAVGVRAALQNTYFLYRDDGFLAGKALFDVAGGHSAATGHLPGVTPTSGTGLDFAWCGTRRRLIDLGGSAHQGYEARSPTDITFSFDSGASRRTASIGRTLYVTDSIPLQYDGTGLYEVGFLIYPYNFFVTAGGAGAVAAGDYVYKSTRAWQNAVAEKERSTTAMGAKITAPGANKHAIQIDALNVTKKSAASIAPTGEVWRTPANPGDETPFYLVSGKDPNTLAGAGNNNGYVPNDVAAAVLPSTGFFILNDNFADTTLTTKEKNGEVGAVLESLAPPGASLILATDTRVFLAGVPGDPDAVWYSRLRNEGEIASFHDGNRVLVPRPGGRITALAIHNDTLTVFRETVAYRLAGEGLNNLGQGTNFVAFEIQGSVGALSQESVASVGPIGTIFKSSKGWYVLTPSWQLRYIGAQVNAFDGDTVYAVTVVESEHHVRIVTNNRLILWDYSVVTEDSPLGQWAEWTVGSGLDAVMWQGQYVILTATGPASPRVTFTGADFGIDVETTWLKPADTQGQFFLRWLAALGEYRSAHLLRFRLARDYQYDGAGNPVYFDDFAWSPTPTVVGSALQAKHPPSINRMQALKVRITAVTEAVRASLITTALAPQVATSGTVWTATWQAVSTLPGEMGNRVTMSLAFESGTANLIDVRDHYAYVGGRWVEDLNNIGVRVVRSSSPPTVAQLEAAIASGTTGTKLATLSAADATPSKTINVSMVGQTSSASFSAGAYGSPTGEALKLTSLALEYGVDRGINKQLPASQKAA